MRSNRLVATSAFASLLLVGAVIAAPSSNATAHHTTRTTVRPVTTSGNAANGYKVVRGDGDVYCNYPEPSVGAVDSNILTCDPSAAYAIACWRSAVAHNVLCLDDARVKRLTQFHVSGSIAKTKPATHKTPLNFTLYDGTYCSLRDGGAGPTLRNHPNLVASYYCTRGLIVWAPFNSSGYGVNHARAQWTVRASHGESGSLRTRAVSRAWFVGTAISLPAISSITPATGRTSGGNRVTVYGSGLGNVRSVRFGSSYGSSITVVSSSKLQVTTPAHAAGRVDVRVTSPSGTSRATADYFTYIAPPVITGLSVARGTTFGGSATTLTGRNFAGVQSVSFAGVPGTRLRTNSPTSVTVYTPAHSAGDTPVSITTAYGHSPDSTAARFAFEQHTLADDANSATGDQVQFDAPPSPIQWTVSWSYTCPTADDYMIIDLVDYTNQDPAIDQTLVNDNGSGASSASFHKGGTFQLYMSTVGPDGGACSWHIHAVG